MSLTLQGRFLTSTTREALHFLKCIFFFSFFAIELGFYIYILDINSLLDTWFANIFSHSVGCLFILLIASFSIQIFSLMSSYLFLLLLSWLWCRIQKLQNWCQGAFPLFSRSFMASGLIFKSLIHIKLFLSKV